MIDVGDRDSGVVSSMTLQKQSAELWCAGPLLWSIVRCGLQWSG